MARTSFSQVIEVFGEHEASGEELTFASLTKLERIILDHIPTSPMEAVAMLDVAIPEIVAGGRSDGRDVKALISIRKMLSG